MGDRLELQSLDVTVPGSNVTLSASATLGSAAQLTTLLTPARPTFLDTTATGYLGVLASNTPVVGDWLQLDFTKTNGTQVTVSVTNTAPGTTIATLVQNLLNLVNANPALQSADGVLAADFVDDTSCGIVAAQFTLYARSPGWPASQIQVTFTASTNLLALPSGTNLLQDNLTDLRPRNHLYVSSGAASLPVSFVLDTTRFPDGFHQLTAVAYEGTSVRTQTRISRTVRIQNTALTATLHAAAGRHECHARYAAAIRRDRQRHQHLAHRVVQHRRLGRGESPTSRRPSSRFPQPLWAWACIPSTPW